MAEGFAAALAEAYLYEINRISLRQQRIFRDRSNAFDLSDQNLIKKFRLSKELTFQLIQDLRSAFPRKCNRTTLDPKSRVLVALRFFEIGCYQEPVGSDFTLSVSQATVRRCITDVSAAVMDILAPKWVQFPKTAEAQQSVKAEFMQNFGLPGVIGAIDGTHVAIIAPSLLDSEHPPEAYIYRKNYSSINVQLVCDANLRILNVNAKLPGITNDAFIWKSSKCREFLLASHRRDRNNRLLGDSGYPLEPWLLTPIRNPQTQGEEALNRRLVAARNTIERCNGSLKSRFRCVLKDRALHYHPTKAAQIINACVVLHNISVANNIEYMEQIMEDDNVPQPADNSSGSLLNEGREIQQNLVRLLRL